MKNLVILVFLISQGALACSDFHWEWNADDWKQKSDAIYYGMVASISLNRKSVYDGETEPLLNTVSLRGEKHIKFKVFETLKGKNMRVVEAVLPECIGGVADFGNSALLFKVGKVWHIKQKNESEIIVKNIITELSKINTESEKKP